METEIQKTTHTPKSFVVNLILTVLFCAIIFIQSSYPAPETLPKFPFMDKILHFLGYAFLGALFYRTFESAPCQMNIQLAMVMAMVASPLYGITDEIHQYFVPYRQADIMDAAVDGIGSIFGVCIYRFVLVRFGLFFMRRKE